MNAKTKWVGAKKNDSRRAIFLKNQSGGKSRGDETQKKNTEK